MRPITEIIIHCTATPEGREFSIDDIRRWHRARGFADVGYHFVIHLDGSVSTGRPLTQAGAHCAGHNNNSIGVAYVGGKELNAFFLRSFITGNYNLNEPLTEASLSENGFKGWDMLLSMLTRIKHRKG